MRRALALADVAQFSKANRDGVANLLQHAEELLKLNALAATASDVECVPADLADEARQKACIDRADMLWAKSDLAGVEALAARLTAEVKCGSLERNEMEAFRTLHFARVLLYGPGGDSAIFTVCGLAGRLNADGNAPYAAIVAWPLIHEHILNNVFDERTADVAAHTARRLIREFNNHLAWSRWRRRWLTFMRGTGQSTIRQIACDDAGNSFGRQLRSIWRITLSETSGQP